MNKNEEPLDMTSERKFQALTMLYQKHADLLRFMTTHDLQIFGGYLSIQLALSSWLSQNTLNYPARATTIILDAIVAFIAAALIYQASKRRQQIHALFDKLNRALLFKKSGSYLPDAPLMLDDKRRLWGWWYISGIVIAFIAVAFLVIVGGGEQHSRYLFTGPNFSGA
jgi:hypothetical protein